MSSFSKASFQHVDTRPSIDLGCRPCRYFNNLLLHRKKSCQLFSYRHERLSPLCDDPTHYVSPEFTCLYNMLCHLCDSGSSLYAVTMALCPFLTWGGATPLFAPPLEFAQVLFLPQSQWKTRNPPELCTQLWQAEQELLYHSESQCVCVCVLTEMSVCVTANEKDLYGLWRMNLMIFCWTCRTVAVYFMCSHNNNLLNVLYSLHVLTSPVYLYSFSSPQKLSDVTFQLEQVWIIRLLLLTLINIV